jgi:hypothetical protein
MNGLFILLWMLWLLTFTGCERHYGRLCAKSRIYFARQVVFSIPVNRVQLGNLETSPPALLNECIGDYALTGSGFQK